MSRQDVLRSAISALEADRDTLQAEIEARLRRLKQINELVAGLRLQLEADCDPSVVVPPFTMPSSPTFANATVRDGIKAILENEPAGLTTAELADQLRVGGMKSRSKDFLSNVSATLSLMAKRYNEVIQDAGRWHRVLPDAREEEERIDDATPF